MTWIFSGIDVQIGGSKDFLEVSGRNDVGPTG